MTLFPCTSFCGPGDLKKQILSGEQKGAFSGPNKLAPGFANDVHVRGFSVNSIEINQTMASDSNGNLYVAWQDDFLSKDYIQIYWSQDGGRTWYGYGNIQNKGADLKEPCLAVGEGAYDKLIVTYIVDDEYAEEDYVLQPDQELSFIPPVSGG